MSKKLLKMSVLACAFTGIASGISNHVYGSFGQFASGVFMRVNGNNVAYNTSGSGANAIGSQDMPSDLGTFEFHTGSLIINGAEMKTFKDYPGNVCGVTYYYSVNPASNDCATCSVVSGEIVLPFKADCSGGVFTDGYGPCGGNDQKWNSQTGFIHLSDLAPGDYILHMYYSITGSYKGQDRCDFTANYGTNLSGPNNLPLCVSAFHVTPRASGKANKGANGIAGSLNGSEVPQHATIRTYPNPVNNMVAIDAENFDNGPVQMQVTDIRGATISKNVTVTYIKGQPMTLDLRSHEPGMYFIRLQQGTKKATAKIVKQ